MANKAYRAEDIAKWFLSRNRETNVLEGGDENISNLKLQKLLYYAQGTHYALTEKKLFNEDIMAWTHGPVVESIYHRYKENGSDGIKFEEEYDINYIDKDTKQILEEVYDCFGQYSAWKLRNMTHEEEPWKNTKPNEVIDLEIIKNYFMREIIE